MSSACTCHINPETCWWCLYEKEKEKTKRYEKAISDLKNLYLDYRSGVVGDISDSFLVDCSVDILKELDNTLRKNIQEDKRVVTDGMDKGK